MLGINKIHHISAIVGDVQENLNFYRDILGLRLIKQTVNFDDPSTYHLYFANDNEKMGTVITFFPWQNAYAGRVGGGQVGKIAFSIPKGSLTSWEDNFKQLQIPFTREPVFSGAQLHFSDPHGLSLSLVESTEASDNEAITDIHGVELLSTDYQQTLTSLTKHLGMSDAYEEADVSRIFIRGESVQEIVLPKTNFNIGRFGVGTVHHIAWSVPNDIKQMLWQDKLMALQYGVTEIKDRRYFKAIYLKEFGNIIFELATETPGFTIDESLEHLGETLMLPSQFESLREQIMAQLPELKV
ncbi:VOC family protein [Vagococcus xieshaowenii]|uniref:Ring-cleaving dioxygenase n=1 Tax=Vagococcus xieshaowenii TaxID=2562451 RepID=A0AAJ5JL30_9ENTE|nr:VOC family protein [Vagococcus xieshaowenii]QCA28671.1 ring-cleaving dioxygenase [Vagococcus xieshaowenii]TFZ40521.1 ring-cleaving dioxygenase [Vagococcus xieshaowenii]